MKKSEISKHIKLLPCPFCGSDAVVLSTGYMHGKEHVDWFQVGCVAHPKKVIREGFIIWTEGKCGAWLSDETLEKSAAKWNRRECPKT